MNNHPRIEIMDTTLRDGEQTSGVSFVPHEKLMIARLLLEDLKVDRIEIASARVSEGEAKAVKMICDWAARRGMLSRVEVLGFVDGNMSVDWIYNAGCRVINLLTKGSEKHCTFQLKKTLDQHLADILGVVRYAHGKGMDVNVYLEDWSNGIKDSPDYVFGLVDGLKDCGIKRFMLPDTLGVLNPLQVIEFMRKMKKRYPDLHFDFHAHNDYDLAVSNVLAAVLSGVKGLHTTINGLGERAGNAPLASVQAILKDHFHAITNIDESRLNVVSRLVESYSGVTIPANKPIVGDSVFTQVAGVHADGDNKNNLYCNDLLPERFGRIREYALGKNSGKANIRKNLESLGLELDEESMKKVKVLSGGERTRLAMIKLLLEPVNLLILDEPTSQLDMKTKDILKQALKDFDGTLIVVSHDRDFLDGLVTKVYEFGNQRVKEHLCGIYEFLETKKMENLRELEKKN